MYKVYINVLFRSSNINTDLLCRPIAFNWKSSKFEIRGFHSVFVSLGDSFENQRNIPEDHYPVSRH